MGEEKKEKKITEDKIRFTLGAMSYSGGVNTEKTFNNGLKPNDPIIIIHKDDFMQLIDQPRDPGIHLKFTDIRDVMSKW